MKVLAPRHFPIRGMKNLRFITTDGFLHLGYYDFDEKCWFDYSGNQYKSNQIAAWEDIDPIIKNLK